MAPSTPPRSAIFSNSFSTASSTSSFSSSMMNAPWFGFSFFARPHSRLMMSWIAIAQRDCPDAPRDASEHGVLGVHAVAEEEAQVGREVVDVHAAREISLDEGE